MRTASVRTAPGEGAQKPTSRLLSSTAQFTAPGHARTPCGGGGLALRGILLLAPGRQWLRSQCTWMLFSGCRMSLCQRVRGRASQHVLGDAPDGALHQPLPAWKSARSVACWWRAILPRLRAEVLGGLLFPSVHTLFPCLSSRVVISLLHEAFGLLLSDCSQRQCLEIVY